ncbi:DUF885 domain-containing protein [Xanthovirga aplysinae]|uniref:DUF885 domain-containing protein n=1 Tax=Xanthovirga aplysinae TaxID=2529853 RepID=UPI00165719F1|nr:DUF885 domain-containing protein [Xanthovirga aplysinae]
MKGIYFLLIICTLAISCSETKKVDSPSPDINQLADIYVSNSFKFYPELGTFYGIDNPDHAGLSDNSLSGLEARQAAEDSLIVAVRTINPDELSKSDLITYNILKNALESSINNRICKKHLWTINQMDAFYTWFRYIGNTQPVGDTKSREDAIQRWKQIPRYIRVDRENNKLGLESGYALPEVIVKQVIDQLDQLTSGPLDTNPFFLPALRDTSEQFKTELKTIVLDEILPEIATYKEFLQNEYLDKARAELSISSIPNGTECYQASLSGYTTLNEAPEVIFQWGEEAIALRERKITKIGNKVYGELEIPAIQNAFKSDKSNYFTTKEEILEAAQAAISRAKSKTPEFFGLVPKADVELEPIPELEERTGSSRYLPASDDGSRPATYIQQTYMPDTKNKGDIETTAFHETYPGHHLQIAISRELVQSHQITKYVGNSGFSEGWARYTETLADEMGLYSSDKSRLAMLMGLPTGMIVDPGIHFKNWTREEAINYTLQKQTSYSRADAERYVDRISVWPGQMTTYGVGEMYFLKLRQKAEEKLGKEFNLKEFHDKCLQNGTVPLDFVNEQVKNWLNTKTK